ncbi:hypothetical protein IU431_06360 [Nocardia otitidiscaviarum]|uniref:hypothetical protein n=1 Tax=Nocardia otitidiscaviarum TaxID=1823 RepID=UPI0006934BB9|nr:hypothetical protein [Nocardia otitidiscaviarum]MBF6483780.1 hypothetical protein [Nocardia otitidiscaviarum]
MRLHFDLEEDEEFTAAAELLVRRCAEWARWQGTPIVEPIAGIALEARHLSSDGRLGHWTPDAVCDVLLDWIPDAAAEIDRAAHAPDTLRALLAYLAVNGLLDPRGSGLDELLEVITETEPEFRAELQDALALDGAAEPPEVGGAPGADPVDRAGGPRSADQADRAGGARGADRMGQAGGARGAGQVDQVGGAPGAGSVDSAGGAPNADWAGGAQETSRSDGASVSHGAFGPDGVPGSSRSLGAHRSFGAHKALDAHSADADIPEALLRVLTGDLDAADLDAADLDPAEVDDLVALLESGLISDGPDLLVGDEASVRTFAQPPVVLPDRADLVAAAEAAPVVRQLRLLLDWVGAGRALTAHHRLRIADARELVALLDTGDELEGVRDATRLRELTRLLAWAKHLRLVRVAQGELRPVAETRPLLRDPLALWSRAFDAVLESAEITYGAARSDELPPLSELHDLVLPDMLNTLYGMPQPMPLRRLEEPVWAQWSEAFADVTAPSLLRDERQRIGADLLTAFQVLDRLGAVELTRGIPDPMYLSDLNDPELDPVPWLDAKARKALRTDLRKPGTLLALTGLGTAAVRDRMLAEGREAGAVGDLRDADAAGLLGVIADHYTAETGRLEIQGWLDAHHGDREPLLQAIRDCPFRGRAAAMLRILMLALPDGPRLLRGLRGDPVLTPLVITQLVSDGELSMTDVTDDEGLLAMTESMLQLLELGGPAAVLEQLADMPSAERGELAETLGASGHPARTALAELLTVIRTPTMSGRRNSGGG